MSYTKQGQTRFQDRTYVELVKLLYRQISFAIWAESFAAIGLVAAMWSGYNHLQLLIWLSVNLLFCGAARHTLVYCFRVSIKKKELDRSTARYWLKWFTLGAFISGVSWGFAGAIFMIPHDVVLQTFLVFLLIGVTAAANPYYSPFSEVYASFLLPAFLPFSIWLMLQGGVFIILGCLAVIYIIIMYASAVYSQKLISTSLELRFANENLLEDLSKAIKTVERRSHDLEKSFATLKATLESTTDGILAVDDKNNILTFNHKFLEMWRIPAAMTEGVDAEKNMINYVCDQLADPHHFLGKVEELYSSPEAESYDELHFKDGRVYERYSMPQRVGNKSVGRVWSFRDVTGRRLLENQLYQQANYDALTSLPNRALVLDRISQGITYSKRYKTMIAILFLDLDRFKIINDTLGHTMGDKLLQTVAERLKKAVRENDTVSREGGDEFLIILNSLLEEEDAIVIARKCLNIINQPIHIDGNKLSTSISIGISVFPKDGEDTETLIRNADIAMYRSKEMGGNTFQFYTEEMNLKVQKRSLIESQLRVAMDNHEFYLLYQPIINLKTKKVSSFEALLRWRNPKLGLIMPSEFIPIAEECGIIIPLGEWIIKTACKQVKKWQDLGSPDLYLSLNISLRQLRQENFIDMVKSCFVQANLNSLALEITESVIMDDVEKNKAILNQLKDMGIKIMIDDFGTGYSSLSYLKQLPVDRLKIDKSFIKDLPNDAEDAAITTAIIALAEQLDLKVIAEGVVNDQQLEFLIQHNCNEAQGYYFSTPLTPEEAEKFFLENQAQHPVLSDNKED